MEVDCDYITYVNILNGYNSMLEECVMNINIAMKECQRDIENIDQMISEPKLGIVKNSNFFTDIDGNEPMFFEKENGEKYVKNETSSVWSVEDIALLHKATNDIKIMKLNTIWNSICAWGPTAMLPIFQLLGTNYVEKQITSLLIEEYFDSFSKGTMVYPNAVASFKVGKALKDGIN